ncbi:hypothetical protein CBM2600_A60110 [Cupriavidus taiwanensis]|nr:hypothetical protein CBM2600_A60110 [Cupriavidus taiwanensis]
MAASHVRSTGTRAWHTRGAQRTARVAAMGGMSRKPTLPRFLYLPVLARTCKRAGAKTERPARWLAFPFIQVPRVSVRCNASTEC